MSKLIGKLTESMDKLPGRLDRFKESVAYAVNPNHRHDEDHEKEVDAQLAAIRGEHPFNSFAGPRTGNKVKWYISGHDYFYALSELLEEAKETIWILDWWLTPELYLRRPPAKHEEYRLDRLLKRKAEQGVKIFVMVYKEVTQTMTMSSAHTKHYLEDLHENISVMRHPDHAGGELTMFWSHHEKVVVVDNSVACIGGLDICFGRWDTQTHPLSDVHPTDFSRVLYPGQDFNNARVQDFQQVDEWVSNQQSRLETARMPWHDIHSMLVGDAVLDIAQHFVERWNFVGHLKYRHQHERFPTLAFPHPVDPDEEPPQSAIVRHPHLKRFAEIGRHFHAHKLEPPEGWPKVEDGTVKVQVVRSSADWSHGILTEHSILNAYRQIILESKHCLYIENQFFITTTGAKKTPVSNSIGAALVQRVVSAAKAYQRFKVVIVIPAVPGFAGDLDAKGSSGTLCILGAQLKSIEDIFNQIRAEGVKPEDFIEFYNLRSYDRINHDPARIRRMEEKSGVTWYQAQAALARLQLGRTPTEDELRKNKEVLIAVPQEGGEQAALAGDTKKKVAANEVKLSMPETYEEAEQIVQRFEQADSIDEKISDSVAHHAQKGTGSLFDEKWSGDEASERNAYVTEECYIHSKLMIVDDRRVIIGSANLNDRSQLGDRDSEIACVYDDEDMIESQMDGKPYRAARFAATLRRQLFKAHLGLAPPQFCPAGDTEPVTPAMRMVGVPHTDLTDSEEDQIVKDPLSHDLEALWRGTASRNAAAFSRVFNCVPAAGIQTWQQYKDYVPKKPIKVGHVARADMPVQYIKEQLDQIRGHLVPMPLDFLSREKLFEFDASVNPLTLNIYL